VSERIRHLLGVPVSWAVLLTVLYLVGAATNATPYLFGPEEWRWHGRPPSLASLPRWWPSLALLVFYLLAVVFWIDSHRADRPSRRREWTVLAFLIVMAPAIQVAFTYIRYRYPVEFYLYRTIGHKNGFWQVAIGAATDLGPYLRTYPQQMQAHSFVHTPVHPPGNVVYIWLWRKGFEMLPGVGRAVAQYLRAYNCADLGFVNLEDAQIASALAQMVIPLFSGLAVIPLYLMGKRLAGSRVGFRAAALYVIVPSLTLFTMRWDQLYPLFLCLSLYWLHLALEERRLMLFFLSGLTASIASFMSFGNLTIFPALGAYGLAHLASTGLSHWPEWLRRTLPGWGLLALGGASVWLVYQAVYGVSFWDVFSTAMQTHFHLGRSYWVWVGYNPYDFLTFLGVPVAVLFVAESARAWRKAIRTKMAVPVVPIKALPALAISATLLALNLSGAARGEVGRMWLLWMPVACLVVAIGLARDERRRSYHLILVLLALQTLSFHHFLRVHATGMPRFAPHQPETTLPDVDYRLDARLGDEIALVGYDLEPLELAPGEKLHLTLYWQALEQPYRPYTVFVHLLDETGRLGGQQDNMPVKNSLPTTCWQPGEFVADSYDIPLDSDTPPGDYTLEVGMYYLPTGERLPVTAPPGHPPDRLLLQPVRVLTPCLSGSSRGLSLAGYHPYEMKDQKPSPGWPDERYAARPKPQRSLSVGRRRLVLP
jgi:hypothetical protein